MVCGDYIILVVKFFFSHPPNSSASDVNLQSSFPTPSLFCPLNPEVLMSSISERAFPNLCVACSSFPGSGQCQDNPFCGVCRGVCDINVSVLTEQIKPRSVHGEQIREEKMQIFEH